MYKRGGVNPNWPTPHHHTLLVAALNSDERARQAWLEWISTINLEQVDDSSRRLLPLLYRNLQAQGITAAQHGVLKGLHHRTWYQNQLLMAKFEPIARDLAVSALPVLALDALAMNIQYYQDYGVRSIDDIKIMVRRQDIHTALETIQTHAWAPASRSIKQINNTSLDVAEGIRLVHPTHPCIWLQWHLAREISDATVHADNYSAVQPAQLQGVPIFVFSPTDQLVDCCMHGLLWNPTSGLTWIADALTILSRAPDSIDWNRLITHARLCRLTLRLGQAFSYLREQLDAPIPDHVLQQLRSTTPGMLERLEHRALTHPPSFITFAIHVHTNYLRRRARSISSGRSINLVQYLRFKSGL